MTGPTAPRWLWLSAELPGDLDTGLKVYSNGLTRALAERGCAVTVVGHGSRPDDAAEAIEWIEVDAELRTGLRSVASRLPNLSYAAAGPEMRAAIEAQFEREWDVVVLDHLQMAWVDLGRLPRSTRTVFVTHNHEASVRREVARSHPWWSPRGALLRWDAEKAARLERSAATGCDRVTAISHDDADRFVADGIRPPVVVPPGYDDPDRGPGTPMAERPRRVAVVGSFRWHVKAENLRTMVSGLAPALDGAGIELAIGGELDPDQVAELQAAMRGVHCVGWVDSIGDFLSTARIGLVAEPLGGGFKLKSLDYVFHHVPMAVVRGGIAGLPLVDGESVIEADDVAELGTSIVGLVDEAERLEAIATEAYEQCRRGFSWRDRAATLVAGTQWEGAAPDGHAR